MLSSTCLDFIAALYLVSNILVSLLFFLGGSACSFVSFESCDMPWTRGPVLFFSHYFVITRIRSAWGKFRELLPILTSRVLSYITRGQIYSTYIRTVLLYASECWAPNVNDLLKLQRNDRAMIRWTCNVRLKDHISSDSLLRKLGVNNIQTLLRYNRLRWFGHVVRNDGCINSITEFEVVGQRGRGRPKKTWKDTINNDLRHWKLSRADPANRMEWRKKLRTNIGAVRPTLSGTDTLNE